MIRKLLTLIVILVAAGLGYFYGLQQIQKSVAAPSSPDIHMYTSPHGGCTEAVVEQLSKAKSNVLVQAYSFTSEPIAKALVDAHKRGVQVQVILDKSQRTEKYSEADFIAHAGIRTLIDAKHAIAHNKIMVIDGDTVITGKVSSKRLMQSRAASVLFSTCIINSRRNPRTHRITIFKWRTSCRSCPG